MAIIVKITKEQIETALGFEILSFTQTFAVETPTYIQYNVTVVPVVQAKLMVMSVNKYVIQINKDGGEESI